MPLNITDPVKHVGVLNKWAHGTDKSISDLQATSTQHLKFITQLQTDSADNVKSVGPVDLKGLTASQTAVNLYQTSSSGARPYLVTYYLVRTRAATTSSSLTVSVAFNDGVTNQTNTSSADTTNTLGHQFSGSFVVYAAASTSITYTITYASVGGTTMQYSAFLRVLPL